MINEAIQKRRGILLTEIPKNKNIQKLGEFLKIIPKNKNNK
jgi:hypothetical protein